MGFDSNRLYHRQSTATYRIFIAPYMVIVAYITISSPFWTKEMLDIWSQVLCER
mgnify:CR=1 FL=1